MINQIKEKLIKMKKDLVEKIPDELTLENASDDCDIAQFFAMSGTIKTLDTKRIRNLELIDNSLAKIELGQFGICEECGDKIGHKRLLSNPLAELCIHCQSEAEE